MNKNRKIKEIIADISLKIIGVLNIMLLIAIFGFIFTNSIGFFKSYSVVKFLTGRVWIPLSDIYGVLPLLVGTFWITVVALIISVPLGIIIAIYLREYASKKYSETIKMIIETMSALPSVVLGYIGLYVLSEPIKKIFGLNTGLTALTGGIMLTFMALPTIVSFTDDALNSLDPSYKEASLSLGANELETIVKIMLPAALPGIFAGIMLGFGRVIGETMTVLMVTGNAPILAGTPLSSVRALTSTIASEMGEVVKGSLHYHSLFALGLLLFIISFVTNSVGDIYVRRTRKLLRK